MEEKFNVLYAKKSEKKRKVFSDGQLIVTRIPQQPTTVTLKDDEGKDVYKKKGPFQAQVNTGDEFVIGGAYEIQVEGLLDVLTTTSTNTGSSTTTTMKDDDVDDKKKFKLNSGLSVPSRSIPISSSSSSSKVTLPPPPPQKQTLSSTTSSSVDMSIDSSLLRIMRPHQVEGAQFLIGNLLGAVESHSLSSVPIENANDDDDDDDFISKPPTKSKTCQSHDSSSTKTSFSGAILADEMGLGKTLTAIATVWTFVRRGQAKGIIVCPSTLVDNWDKEVKQWMGVKLVPIVVKSGPEKGSSSSSNSAAAAAINTFKVGHITKCPLLIISYELFRKYAAVLNEVPKLDIIVCDEGHRLKNAGGNKTIQVLSDCKAKKRIVLTGTPIQNDLDELYSVVSFVVPSFLGSLSHFKRVISGPIIRGREPNASQQDIKEGQKASKHLRSLLSKIMLRRTQQDILKKLLPPRTDVLMYLNLTTSQQMAYEEQSTRLQQSLGCTNNADMMLDDVEDDNDEALEVVNSSSSGGSFVLPGLQKLRTLCNMSDAVMEDVEISMSSSNCNNSTTIEDNNNRTGGKTGGWVVPQKKASTLSTGGKENNAETSTVSIDQMLQRSSKLMVLDVFLRVLRQTSPDEKAVVVSNFTSTLDHIEKLAKVRGFGTLRIDGSVATDKRQNLVDCFNRASDRRFLFLLSAKAGGMGINLIGGSRLIMFDCDWNPAVDVQAMSRVWREGQLRPVFIYRLIAHGYIEDAMIQRQASKVGLASGVMVDGCTETDDITSSSSSSSSKGFLSLTKKDVLALIHPKSSHSSCTLKTTNEEANDGDNVLVGNNDDMNEDEGDDDVATKDAVLIAFRTELSRTAGCESLLKHIKKG